MNVRTFLDTATGHLAPQDAALLVAGSREPDALPFDSMSYEHGWIVSTASLIDDEGREEQIRLLRECGFSEAFVSIVDLAGRLGCWLLRFDRDEDLDPQLPIGGYGLLPGDLPCADAFTREGDLDATGADETGLGTASDSPSAKQGKASLDGRVHTSDASATTAMDAFEKLVVLRALYGDDTDTAALEWRRHLVDCERQRRLVASHDLPAFRVCHDWGHHFADEATERTVRWTFDKRSWSLAQLEIMDEATGTWRAATQAEWADVDESLVTANLEALTEDPEGWGCVDTHEWPLTTEGEHLQGAPDVRGTLGVVSVSSLG